MIQAQYREGGEKKGEKDSYLGRASERIETGGGWLAQVH